MTHVRPVVYIKHCLFTALKTREYSSLSPHQRALSYTLGDVHMYVYWLTRVFEQLQKIFMNVHRNYKTKHSIGTLNSV